MSSNCQTDVSLCQMHGEEEIGKCGQSDIKKIARDPDRSCLGTWPQFLLCSLDTAVDDNDLTGLCC